MEGNEFFYLTETYKDRNKRIN